MRRGDPRATPRSADPGPQPRRGRRADPGLDSALSLRSNRSFCDAGTHHHHHHYPRPRKTKNNASQNDTPALRSRARLGRRAQINHYVLRPRARRVRRRRRRQGHLVRGDVPSPVPLDAGLQARLPSRRVAATPRPRRRHSVKTSRGDATAATRTFREDESRRRDGGDEDIP